MSFGAMHRTFSERCVRLMLEGKEDQAKTDLREFVEYLRSKQPLLSQFYVYENLRSHHEPDRGLAVDFIKDTLRLVEDLSRGDMYTYNNLMKATFNIRENPTPLEEAISVLIESKVSDFMYDTARVNRAMRTVLEHVMTEKEPQRSIEELTRKHNQFSGELEFFTPQDVVRIGVKKFNKEFGPLFTESERTLFNKIRLAGDSQETLAELYDEEYTAMLAEADRFTAGKIDDDIKRNINLAKEKLRDKPSVDNLVNIFELRTQMQALRGQR